MNKTSWHHCYDMLVLCCVLYGLVCGGCVTSLMPPKAVSQTVTMPISQEQAYGRALRAFGQLGGQITMTDQHSGVISGQVHNAVTLYVHLEPVQDGTRVLVSGTLLPGKLAVGSFTEVQDYIALLH